MNTSWPEMVTATFETVSVLFIALSIRSVLIRKHVSGVSWVHVGFYCTWGFWNLVYYPKLDQMLAFYAGIGIVVANTTWMILLIYYTYKPGGVHGNTVN